MAAENGVLPVPASGKELTFPAQGSPVKALFSNAQ